MHKVCGSAFCGHRVFRGQFSSQFLGSDFALSLMQKPSAAPSCGRFHLE